MNLLAHALLSDGSDESILGNIAADFIRPVDVDRLPTGVRWGVVLHRHVDGFTDRHPVVQRSIARISKNWGWFSGILIDVYFDYILAEQWSEYVPQPLRDFVDRVHRALVGQIGCVSEPANGYLCRLVATDRLMSYASLSGIERALSGLSARIAERIPARQVRLEKALPELRAVHAELAADFREFFPLVRAFAANWSPPETPKARGVDPRALGESAERST